MDFITHIFFILRVFMKTAKDPTLWFNVIEAQFELCNITDSTTKYNHVLIALDYKALSITA